MCLRSLNLNACQGAVGQNLLEQLHELKTFTAPLGQQSLHQAIQDLSQLLILGRDNFPLEILNDLVKRKLQAISDQIIDFQAYSTKQVTIKHHSQQYRIHLLAGNELISQWLTHCLENSGLKVTSSSDWRDALQQLDVAQVELLLIQMDENISHDYPQLLLQLRSNDQSARIPVLFLAEPEQQGLLQSLLAMNDVSIAQQPLANDQFQNLVIQRTLNSKKDSRFSLDSVLPLYERLREKQALDSHAIVSIADSNGDITYVNDKFCEITGYQPEELIGQSHRILKSGIHPPEFFSQMWKTITSGQIWHGEVCNKRKDGSFYWVKASITPFIDKDGKPYKYISYRTEITSTKLAEERLRQLLGSLGEGVYGTDITGRCTFANKAALDMLGYTQEEILGKNTFELFSLYDSNKQSPIPNNPVALTLSDHQRHSAECFFKTHDGSVLPVELTATPKLENDICKGAQVIFRDISRRKLIEEKLRKSEDRFRMAQNYANIGSWEWNIETNDLFWSDKIAPLFGYPEGELKTSYENFLNAIHPEDKDRVISAINRCIDNNQTYFVEHRVIWPDKKIRWVSEHGNVVRNSDGKAIKMLGVVIDIHRQKVTEQQLRRSEANLLLFRHIFEASNQYICITDRHGELTYVNPSLCQRLGYSKQELSQQHFKTLIPRRVFKHVKDNLDRVLKQGQSWNGQVPVQCKDGSEFISISNIGAILDQSGEIENIFNIFSDFSAELTRRQELDKAKVAAEKANQAKSEFLSSMNHELRTPLNSIIGFAQLMEFDNTLEIDQQENLQEIIKAGKHLLQLINDVLDLAKIEAGHIEISLEQVALQGSISECINLIKPLADARAITINTSQFANLTVKADKTRLKQIVLNLLSNAVKYNRQNGKIVINVYAIDKEFLKIEISDTGVGIPPNRTHEVFQPFNRLNAEQSGIEGSGVGLPVTKRLTELMGGRIGVKSDIGQGSTFWIELPSDALITDPEIDTETIYHVQKTTLCDKKQYRVLCIDDNPANIKLLKHILSHLENIETLTSFTSQLGLELAIAHTPDLIFLDINMPDMNGYNVLTKLKHNQSTADIPVVAITANATTKDIEKGLNAGFDDYITKPIVIKQFLETVDKMLSQGISNHH